MEIILKNNNDDEPIIYSVQIDISVEGLRRIIMEDLGLREDRQTLIFGTRVLKNNNTLESYGIKDGSELYLVDLSQEEIV